MPPIAKKNKNKPNHVPTTASKDVDAGVQEEQSTSPTPVISGQLEKKMIKNNKRADKKRGIVFIKHLPHGFFEEQIKKYFEQFGNVTNLRLARSKRTGGSKGFAFVEFEYPEVAQIAAETMDNYLMFQRVVKAAYIPPEKQQFNYFKTSVRMVKNKAGKEIYVSGKSAAIRRKIKIHNEWSDKSYQKRTAAKLRKLDKMEKKYAHLGIDFSNIVVQPNILSVDEKAAKEKKASEELPNEAVAPSGSLLLIKKRKPASLDDSGDCVNEMKKQKKSAGKKTKEIGLEDLLGNTIDEEGSSEDEDFIATESGDKSDAVSSDEETYGFTKYGVGEDDEEDEDDDDDGKASEDSDDEDNEVSVFQKKGKSSYGKSTKPQKVDRLEKMIKRKPHLGGIQKYSTKSLKKAPTSMAKSVMQIAAAKEITKGPLVKGKSFKKLAKKSKNVKQRA